MGAPIHLRISQSDDGNNPSQVRAAATLSTTSPTFADTPICSNAYSAGALQAEGVTAPASLTQRLLLWQISQLTYICGSVCIELPQLISTANSLFGFFCDTGQPVLDALVDEAGNHPLLFCRQLYISSSPCVGTLPCMPCCRQAQCVMSETVHCVHQ